MASKRIRLHVLCEDDLHHRFVEEVARRAGFDRRLLTFYPAPRAKGSASKFVLDNFVAMVRQWRRESHDLNVKLLVVVDGDQYGVERRRRELATLVQAAGLSPIAFDGHGVAVVVPTWHIETWIAWLCGHRPVDEETRYKDDDPAGRDVGRRIKSGEYSVKRAIAGWLPAAAGEGEAVPSLSRARGDLRRIGVTA